MLVYIYIYMTYPTAFLRETEIYPLCCPRNVLALFLEASVKVHDGYARHPNAGNLDKFFGSP